MNSNQQHIDYDLLMLYLTKQANSQQVNEAEEWINAAPENKIVLDELEKLWIETGKISPPPVAVDTDLAWNKVFNKIQESDKKTIELKPKAKPSNSLFKIVTRVAAVVLVMFGVYGIYKLADKNQPQLTIASSEEVVEQVLPDQSKIDLNTGSKITYPEKFSGKTREVKLEGEAFFDVSENKKKPFVIQTEMARITVLGTSFNVKAYPDSNKVEVMVQSGTVRLDAKTKMAGDTSSVILEAGESGIINLKAKTIKKLRTVDENKLFWKTNRFVFDNFKLKNVIEVLKDHFEFDVILSNKELENCLINSSFENEELDYIMETIAGTLELNLTKNNTTYILEGPSCE